MLTFRSLFDVQNARLPPKIHQVAMRSMRNLLDVYGPDYDPEDDGWVVVVTRYTSDQDAMALFGRPWADARLEGVTRDQESGCFLTCVLCNNQFGYTIIVPDAPWLSPAFRALLVSELVEQ